MTRRVAIVTGAGGSIGSHVATVLARAGFAVAVADIDEAAAARCVQALRSDGAEAMAYAVDVADSSAVDRMVDMIEREQGAVSMLVNNAGNPGRFSLLVDMSDAVWKRTLEVHLDGAFYLVRACARRMLRRRWGRIVNVASLAGLHGTVGSGEYGVAKAGLMNLTKTAAKELGPYGITVNAIAPGMVGTPVNASLHEKGSQFIGSALQGTASDRLVDPAGIAVLVAFLASDAAADINGATIPIDGAASVSMTTDAYMRGMLGKRSPFMKEIDDVGDG